MTAADRPTTSPAAYDALAERTVQAVREAPDRDASMQAAVAHLKRGLPAYTWVGIYLLTGNELVLGPYEGPPSPHTRIPLGRGICGAAATERATIIVDDVRHDSRYLACSLETQSEIVVPIMRGGEVLGEIDVDSDRRAAFGPADQQLLERVAAALAARLGASSADTRS